MPTPQPLDAVAMLQQLAHPNAAVVSPQMFLDHIRQLKQTLIRTPEIKKLGLQANFSWKRDIFDPLLEQFFQVLQQKPTDALLCKILSLVDGVADEFEQDCAGVFYNAETDAAALAWRNEMYAAVEELMPQATALQNMQPRNRRKPAGLQQKITLKQNKPRPSAPPLPSVADAKKSSKDYAASPSSYTNNPSQNQAHSNYPDQEDFFDFDDLMEEMPEQPFEQPEQTTNNSAPTPPVKKPEQKNIMAGPQKSANAGSSNFAPLGLGDVSGTPVDHTEGHAAAQREIAELKRFMRHYNEQAPARSRKNIATYQKIISEQRAAGT